MKQHLFAKDILMQRTNSHAQIEKARQFIPGGVNSPARAFGGVGGEPVVIDRGEGARLYDIDGNEYLDYIGSWGPHILGHRHPAVIDAIEQALKKGTSFGAPTEMETEMAELLCEAVASLEKVRMVNSGTEATMSAIRVARGFTGRDVVIKFAGCYHGHVDSLLVQAGSGALTLGVPSSPGIPQGCTKDTIVLEYNNVEQLQKAFDERGSEIACIILEPVVGNMGTVIPENAFLQATRNLCTEHDAVLIFDEVMTGFRVAYGGAQQRLKVTPDMTTLGKIIGGGMPVGAYGGREDIMNVVSPAGPVYQAGTLSGNPVAMASGLATLKVLRDENPYPKLEQLSEKLASGLSAAATKAGLPHQMAQIGSMMTLFFNDQPVKDFSVSSKNDTERFAKYFHGMLDKGIYLPCSQYEAMFVSAAHTEHDINQTIQIAEEVLANLN